jgi:predicted NBD/HSP70 family sugar kinase
MEPLEKEKLIIEVGIGDSSGGRKPVLYDLDTKRFYVLGIDISRPYTEIIIADPKMNVLNIKTFNMDETFTPEKAVQTIASLFQEGLSQLGIERKKFLGVGLGTVGPLNRSTGIMIRPNRFAGSGWVGAPIKNLLEQA